VSGDYRAGPVALKRGKLAGLLAPRLESRGYERVGTKETGLLAVWYLQRFMNSLSSDEARISPPGLEPSR